MLNSMSPHMSQGVGGTGILDIEMSGNVHQRFQKSFPSLLSFHDGWKKIYIIQSKKEQKKKHVGPKDDSRTSEPNSWHCISLSSRCMCTWTCLTHLFLNQAMYAHLLLLNLKPGEAVNVSFLAISQDTQSWCREFEPSWMIFISIMVQCCLDHHNPIKSALDPKQRN